MYGGGDESDNFELLSSTLEGLHTTSHLLFSVSRTQLNSDSCFTLRNYGEAEPNDKDVFFKHLIAQLSRHLRISKPNRGDRTGVMAQDTETSRFHGRTEQFGVGVQLVDKTRTFVKHLVGLERGTNDRRSNRVREQVCSCLVSKHIYYFSG